MATNTLTTQSDATMIAPVIVDLGKTKSRQIKDLKRGQGRLMDDVQYATNQAMLNFGEEANGKVFVPIVLIYKKKNRRRNPFPF